MQIDPKSALDISQRTLEMGKTGEITATKNGQDPAAIRKVAQEFESLFMEIVLKSMRGTVQKSGLVDGGNGEEIFRSMLDSEYAKSMASQGTTGLSDAIANQLLSLVQDKVSQIETQQGKSAYKQTVPEMVSPSSPPSLERLPTERGKAWIRKE